MEKDIIDPFTLFYQQISSIYSESLNEFKVLANNSNESRISIEKAKAKYYDSCKLVTEKESLILKSYSSSRRSSDLDINNANDALLKIKSAAEINSEQYKYELIKFNNKIEEIEQKYQNNIKILKSNEESRVFFVKCHLEKFSKIFEEYTIAGFDYINVSKNKVYINN